MDADQNRSPDDREAPPPAPPAPPVPPAAAPPAAAPTPYGAPPAAPGYGMPPAAPGYGTAPVSGAYAPYASRPAPPPTNTLAWVSFGLALGSIFFGLLTSVAAVVCGHIARSQIRQRGEEGNGIALTGLILGYVVTGLWVAGIVAYGLFVIVAIVGYGISTGVPSSL
ncbi:hypothetical protein GCM10009819_22480 [Agromyces tropicus]|uniref:DUF4190 domain-containing protein n=1 Tax=Agromyces tropicus TaxID=555371 RepID=A0ABP5G1X0_9MICO